MGFERQAQTSERIWQTQRRCSCCTQAHGQGIPLGRHVGSRRCRTTVRHSRQAWKGWVHSLKVVVVSNGDSLHLSGTWLRLVTSSSAGISGVGIAISFHGPTDAITGQTPAINRTRFGPGVGGRTVGARPDKISATLALPVNPSLMIGPRTCASP